MEIANKAEEAHITKPRIDVPPYTLSTNVDQETCMAMSQQQQQNSHWKLPKFLMSEQ